MTNTELIQKIKVEIERMNAIAKADVTNNKGEMKVWNQGIVTAYSYVLSFLSELSEKCGQEEPCEELDNEIKRMMVKTPFFIRGKDLIAFARHFAQWGAEHLKK